MALREILNNYANTRLFSHAYAECGVFAEEVPLATEEFSPDGRDIFDLSSLTKALSTTPQIFSALDSNKIGEARVGHFAGPRGRAVGV